jgi:hypothetical protein
MIRWTEVAHALFLATALIGGSTGKRVFPLEH